MAKLNRMQTAIHPDPVLDRREAVPALIGKAEGYLCVAGLAGTAQELSTITDDSPSVFALGGAMGAAASMALGLALAQPKRRILCMMGDAELLMNLGALATIGLMNPPNLSMVCVDNGRFGETGNQHSHTGLGVALDRIAQGAGFPVTHVINSADDIPEGRRILKESNGLCFILLRVKEGPALRSKRNLVPHIARDRFRASLVGA